MRKGMEGNRRERKGLTVHGEKEKEEEEERKRNRSCTCICL